MSDTNFMSYSDAETVVTGIADKYKTFKGTQAQWDALSLSEKVKYSFADITDDYTGTGVVDAVTNGDMNPVSSNAVYDAIAAISLADRDLLDWNNSVDTAANINFTPTKNGILIAHGAATGATAVLNIIDHTLGYIVACVAGASTSTGLGVNTIAVKGHTYSTNTFNASSTLTFIPFK